MRDSADSDDYGVKRRGSKRGRFDDEQTYVKRNRHLPRLRAEDANDATDGLPEGDLWSTWDQTKTWYPMMGRPGAHAILRRQAGTAPSCRIMATASNCVQMSVTWRSLRR